MSSLLLKIGEKKAKKKGKFTKPENHVLILVWIVFCYYNRPVARFFDGEVRSNEETDQMRPEGHVYGARGF